MNRQYRSRFGPTREWGASAGDAGIRRKIQQGWYAGEGQVR